MSHRFPLRNGAQPFRLQSPPVVQHKSQKARFPFRRGVLPFHSPSSVFLKKQIPAVQPADRQLLFFRSKGSLTRKPFCDVFLREITPSTTRRLFPARVLVALFEWKYPPSLFSCQSSPSLEVIGSGEDPRKEVVPPPALRLFWNNTPPYEE